MAARRIMIDGAKVSSVLADGVRVRSSLGYDLDQLATGLRRACARDFPRGTIVFLVIDCRGPDRGRRLFVFARTAEELFSAGGITGFNEAVYHAG
jgi:hypothetical protein